jgi:hypothetical protein
MYKQWMYLFGGEFTSPNQTKFHHFREGWKCDLVAEKWTPLSSKGGPSARSGHRMCLYQHYVLLFGGFYDNGFDVKYYNDLWAYDITINRWESIGNPNQGPSPRSACQMQVHQDALYVYGGYFRSPDIEDAEIDRAKVYSDMWRLPLGGGAWSSHHHVAAGNTNTNNNTNVPASTSSVLRWEKLSKAGMAPGPRSGFSTVLYKDKLVLFGGVSDRDAGRDGDLMVSEFHNEAYSFALKTHRWFPLDIRPPKAKIPKKKRSESNNNNNNNNNNNEDLDEVFGRNGPGPGPGPGRGPGPPSSLFPDLLSSRESQISASAATRIQSHFRGYVVRKAYQAYRVGGVVSELLYSPASYGVDPRSQDYPKPRGRINAHVTTSSGSDMWIYGGIVEVGDGEKAKEVTLDDLWRVNMDRWDGWELVLDTTVGEEAFRKDGNTSEDTDKWGGSGDEDDGPAWTA